MNRSSCFSTDNPVVLVVFGPKKCFSYSLLDVTSHVMSCRVSLNVVSRLALIVSVGRSGPKGVGEGPPEKSTPVHGVVSLLWGDLGWWRDGDGGDGGGCREDRGRNLGTDRDRLHRFGLGVGVWTILESRANNWAQITIIHSNIKLMKQCWEAVLSN